MSLAGQIDAADGVTNPYTSQIDAITTLKGVASTEYGKLYVYDMVETFEGSGIFVETPVDISAETAAIQSALEDLKTAYNSHYNDHWIDEEMGGEAYKNKPMMLESGFGIQKTIAETDGTAIPTGDAAYNVKGTKTLTDSFIAADIANYTARQTTFTNLVTNQPQIPGSNPAEYGYTLSAFTSLHNAILADIPAWNDTFANGASDELSAYNASMNLMMSYSYVMTANNPNATPVYQNTVNKFTPGVIA